MKKTLFNHLDEIYTKQRLDYYDELSEEDKKSFNIYMINRFLSMNPRHTCIVNEFQQFYNEVGPRETYLFYSQLLPSKKQYNKYVKNTDEGDEYEEWLVSLLKTHFMVSRSEVESFLRIYYRTENGRAALRELCEGYGIDAKRIKKAKLK